MRHTLSFTGKLNTWKVSSNVKNRNETATTEYANKMTHRIFVFDYGPSLKMLLKWCLACLPMRRKRMKAIPHLNYLSTMPLRHMGERKCSSTFLELGTRWRCQLQPLPRRKSPVSIRQEAGRALGLVWTLRRTEKSYTARNRTRAV
jgi:hypothetical protein